MKSQVKQWQDRIAEITAAMQDMQDELNTLTRYVEAVKVFTAKHTGVQWRDDHRPDAATAARTGRARGRRHPHSDAQVLGGKAKPGTIKERLASQAPAGSYAEKLVGSAEQDHAFRWASDRGS